MRRDVDLTQAATQLKIARRQLAAKIGCREEAQVEQVADAMDQVQAAAARELAMVALDRTARELRQIEDALLRIESGDFGTCIDCGDDIASMRLRAIPWALRCLACQQRVDCGPHSTNYPANLPSGERRKTQAASGSF